MPRVALPVNLVGAHIARDATIGNSANGGIARNARSYARSYSSGRTIENPSHMMIVSGIPTRRKSENL